ncbi:MAG: C25 family cysteine peptidase [Bacteroidota bacterium]
MRILKQRMLILLWVFSGFFSISGTVEHTYYFDTPFISPKGDFQVVTFPHTALSGLPGNPMLPYHQVVLLLPPGEEAVSVEWTGEDEVQLPGVFNLFPAQYVRPVSQGLSGDFIRNAGTYRMTTIYPAEKTGVLITQYLNGFAFALTTFTPVNYIPASGVLSWYRKMTILITTRPGKLSKEALKNLNTSDAVMRRIAAFAQNPEAIRQYPVTDSPSTDYQFLIITPELFQNEFQELIAMYAAKGITTAIATTATITATVSGWDLPEKIRNYILSEYQNHHIEYVLLAGNPVYVPYRGFYCQVQSSSLYTDGNIPADLYFSGMDGSFDANGNHVYGEVADEPDLLPEVAVARFPVNDTAELRNMIHKSIAYQTNPVLEEFTRPILAGEHLWANPLTLGGDFMELLIDDHSDSGYFTHGIPSATNAITKLYDSIILPGGTLWQWSADSLRTLINGGRSFIHHLGHANNSYMMRMSISSITNSNFSQVNGTDHNYTFLYTQGCNTGAFDNPACIAAKAVSIDNFLAGGVFNSRYGWFNEGSSDGPSQHLHREFVSTMYTDTLPDRHLGAAHMISKVKTAPWVTLPGEWEPGAQRWCHYCSNALGDPALEIRIEEPSVFTTLTWTGSIDTSWENPNNWTPARIPTSLTDVVIPDTPVKPIITSSITTCHNLTIQSQGNLTISPGKKLTAWGNVTLKGP